MRGRNREEVEGAENRVPPEPPEKKTLKLRLPSSEKQGEVLVSKAELACQDQVEVGGSEHGGYPRKRKR